MAAIASKAAAVMAMRIMGRQALARVDANRRAGPELRSSAGHAQPAPLPQPDILVVGAVSVPIGQDARDRLAAPP